MAIKNLIARGVGFAPGSVKFLPTLGLTVGPAAEADPGLRHIIARGIAFLPAKVQFIVTHGLYVGADADTSGTRRQRQIKSLVRSRRRRR